jgi:integrase
MRRPPTPFYEFMRSNGLREGTAKKYQCIANRWEGSTPAEYLNATRDDSRPANTVFVIVSAAKWWYKYYGIEVNIAETGVATPPRRIKIDRQEALTMLDEMRPYATTARARTAWRAAAVALETGLRGSSLVKLTREQAEAGAFEIAGKGGAVTTGYFTPRAASLVIEQFGADTEENRFDFKPKILRNAWAELRNLYVEKTGDIRAEKVTLHTFRHIFATSLIRKRVELTVVSRMLAHKSIGTTMRYVETSDDEVKDAYKTLTDDE